MAGHQREQALNLCVTVVNSSRYTKHTSATSVGFIALCRRAMAIALLAVGAQGRGEEAEGVFPPSAARNQPYLGA